jgi:hypothetical protein
MTNFQFYYNPNKHTLTLTMCASNLVGRGSSLIMSPSTFHHRELQDIRTLRGYSPTCGAGRGSSLAARVCP